VSEPYRPPTTPRSIGALDPGYSYHSASTESRLRVLAGSRLLPSTGRPREAFAAHDVGTTGNGHVYLQNRLVDPARP